MRETRVYLGAVVCVLVAVSSLDWLTLVVGRSPSLVIACGVGAAGGISLVFLGLSLVSRIGRE